MSARTTPSRHALHGVTAVTVGLGVAYLLVLGAFALASTPRPPALGWLGFGVVAVVVIVATWGVGDFLARSERDQH